MKDSEYQVMGGDGKEYGPVNTQQIRQWIAEERLEKKTPVKPDGVADWVFLETLPEFQSAFAKAGRPARSFSWAGKILLFVVLVLVAGIIYLALK